MFTDKLLGKGYFSEVFEGIFLFFISVGLLFKIKKNFPKRNTAGFEPSQNEKCVSSCEESEIQKSLLA